ncbi:hypothetical protein FKG94_12350 [Exilibacterium tricleocarpae]|uniref:YtxH domain-containing protein n=1 Tax=Exilibacterium tricleocarpae TaxID=2591008 RepID=A0A545TNM0_9GAMM|nr:hypothetical protein [Exilibacterium tricleocarpae]TQV78806.1 hypothetical protein FKG94_12350 [Exilibacterium tricleocarpae]
MKYFYSLFIILTLAIGVVGCEEGPAEEAGEKIDRALDDAGDAVKDAGNAVEDACEDVTGENC